VFSAEVSAADAVLFMLATSLSQDLYKRFINPVATDRQVLRVARAASAFGGVAGVFVALLSKSVIDALSVFYTLLAVSFFVPVVAGLYSRRARPLDALAAVAGGVLMVIVALIRDRAAPSGVISMYGLAGAFVAFALAVFFVRRHE
jgi:SSS family solute:Na+ symporter